MSREGVCGAMSGSEGRSTESSVPWWQTVHAALEGIARQRAGLDAEEARWIREAEAVQIWRPVGMVSMIDYLERICGYEPRTAQHRLRVAKALGDLPQLNEALAQGELSFSAVRELVRVATPATEGAWRAAAQDKNLRQLETLVAGHKPGDHPDDPVGDCARLHSLSFHEVSASSYALFRQARQMLDAENGARLSDSDVIAALANSVLDGSCSKSAPSAPGAPDEPAASDETSHGAEESVEAPAIDGVRGRAKTQVGLIVCKVCERAWQDGGGQRIPITPAERDRHLCDAQHIGDLDAATPARAVQDIPPATVRLIWARDQGCCQTPGCRSSIGLEIHHIIARAHGGSHEPPNLTLRCSSCHIAHHEGRLHIEGTAPDALTTHRVFAPAPPRTAPRNSTSAFSVPPPPVLEPASLPSSGAVPPLSAKYAAAARRTEALTALRSMGWSPSIAKSVVEAASAQISPDEPLEALLYAALRLCPKPSRTT